MNRRLKWAFIALMLVLAIGLYSALRRAERSADDQTAVVEAAGSPTLKQGQPAASPTAAARAAAARHTASSTISATRQAYPSPSATPFPPADEAAMIEADKVSLMVRDYRTLAGENPVGTNAEIMAAVMGGNAKKATLGPPEGMRLNENGELIDRWGTPYFFHQLSRDHMEIRSAGGDTVMWTEDDAIAR